MKILLIFLLIFILGVILFFTCKDIDIYTIKSRNKGKKILLVGGTHGNEPSGFITLLRLQNAFKKNKIKLKSGELTIIHNSNPCGYYLDNRHLNIVGKPIDLNRMYNKNFIINKKIENIVDKYDIILDFHEGWGYIRNNDGSIGSSIQTINIPKYLYTDILKILNSKIDIDYKKWNINTRKSIENTLRDYCLKKHKKYILIETTGQNNVQELSIRVNQNLDIINYILTKHGLI
tara:strand:- start:406 stop:1104 length:699 start_codon:yes stop_codon:yes gene_type:complete